MSDHNRDAVTFCALLGAGRRMALPPVTVQYWAIIVRSLPLFFPAGSFHERRMFFQHLLPRWEREAFPPVLTFPSLPFPFLPAYNNENARVSEPALARRR